MTMADVLNEEDMPLCACGQLKAAFYCNKGQACIR